ncbi:PREDICTED: 39S ribosomal protein L47, mitochondrial [Colobus angolensis palliatus]|uniref:39S ribosomal protein L47, mitochondrial n=1 Tax=Colobus angolensis palliatus TaxID=336983 RepID=UPI0005F4CF86|nr:PREDICTED: 39S ribosomal protein L47, mitochondrial [Colobus angolensis palliatus]
MAAAGLALLCRRVSAALKASRSLITPQVPACTGFFLGLLPKSTPNVTSFHQYRLLHTTLSRKGLEEFFDDPKNWGQEKVKSGAAWTCQQLRNKSNEDLHKLWYVLLKERNMLLTLEQEAKRQRLPMPSPERLDKIALCFFYSRLECEKRARIKARKENLEKKKAKILLKKFPHLAEAQKSSLV